jgi:probable HAF family extracellular repeat protein
VGNACITGCSTLTPTFHAFLWSAAGGIQDLGTLGGRSSFAVGINNAGQVVGYSNPTGSTFYHAFIWTAAGGMKDLGTTSAQISTFASGINASGNLSVILNKFGAQRAAVWTSAKGYQNIPSLNGSPINWVANGINDLNHVAGSSWITSTGPWHAFLWTKSGGSQDLGASLGGLNSYGNAVNASDQVAGYADIN